MKRKILCILATIVIWVFLFLFFIIGREYITFSANTMQGAVWFGIIFNIIVVSAILDD